MPLIIMDWKLFIIGFGLLASVCLVNSRIAVLPVSCSTFILSSVLIWFLSMCTTFVCLHKLVQRHEPLTLFKTAEQTLIKQRSGQKPNAENIKSLIEDIDRHFISKWYLNISKDDDFTQESRLFLEEVISRLAEVQIGVNNRVLLHGILNIYLKHLKEFRRSLKRKEKYGSPIEDLYRFSHHCNNNVKAKDYFVHCLTTNLLRHFINSELWNSLPCQILVSVLARKLVLFLLKISSTPEILNYLILNSLASKTVKDKYNITAYTCIGISQYYDVSDSKESTSDKKEEKPIVNGGNGGNIDEVDESSVEKIIEFDETNVCPEIVSTDLDILSRNGNFSGNYKIMKEPEGKKVDSAEELIEEHSPEKPGVSSSVKIHEPNMNRSIKTYNDSKELALGVSLGQDPLDLLPVIKENVKHSSKTIFWETGKIENYVDESSANAANLLLNEVKLTTQSTMEGIKSSIKPISDATVHTLHNIKDLQESTVNNALHKIGDFQDEAAGMVEGILDFGRAGLRKGLRLTGLQDNIENAKVTFNINAQPGSKQPPKRKASESTKHESPGKQFSDDSLDSVWINPLQMDSPNFDGQILLENTRKSEDKDRKEIQIPSISMEKPEIATDSPDLEYEDTADLASSIAKLRSLLQQRSSESSLSTPALSPILLLARYYGSKNSVADRLPYFSSRPPDEFAQKNADLESSSDLEEVDGMMPSFYKFCAKTATGVLDKTIHTIKTALPSNIQGAEQSDNAWIFIQTDQTEADILTRMKKLLTERKEYCILDTEIDTAYEAIDSLDAFQQMPFSSNIDFEDELDDFEIKLPITKTLVDIVCELLADTDSPFVQEPLVKAIILIVGNALESFCLSKVDGAMESLCINLIAIPEMITENTLFLDLDVFVAALLDSLPDVVTLTFGKETLFKALTLFISSLQNQQINQDVVLQIFELISMKLIEESNQLSPPASA